MGGEQTNFGMRFTKIGRVYPRVGDSSARPLYAGLGSVFSYIVIILTMCLFLFLWLQIICENILIMFSVVNRYFVD